MDKKRSIGVSIVSSIYIMIGTLICLAFSVTALMTFISHFKSYNPQVYNIIGFIIIESGLAALYLFLLALSSIPLITGIFMLKLKPKSRLVGIFLAILGCIGVLFHWFSAWAWESEIKKKIVTIPFVSLHLLLLVFLIIVIIYLTRPKVNEQFK